MSLRTQCIRCAIWRYMLAVRAILHPTRAVYLYKDFVYATFTNGCTNATIDIKAHVLIKPQ